MASIRSKHLYFAAALLILGTAGSALAGNLPSGRVKLAQNLPASTAPVPSMPVAADAKVSAIGNTTHLTFAMSEKVDVQAFVLANPDRVIVDLPEINFQTDPANGKATALPKGTLVHAFRFGLFAPGKSRIVIDLGGPAKILKAAVEEGAGDAPPRLAIDLAPTDKASFRQAAAAALKASLPPTEANAPPKPVESEKPVVVLDPGHGGPDGGANGVDGAVEKTIVFDFAEMLKHKLEASGRYKVVMTRDRDVFVPLNERVKIARDSGAKLFVSIHADTVSDAGNVTGATVYTVSDRASDREAERVAEQENAADAAAGVQTTEDQVGVNDILFDLTRRETRTFSHVFSRTLVNYLEATARMNKNPERSAGFVVLKAPDVPSVLLELGYLSNDRDVKCLTSPDWRDKTTDKVAAAIDTFFAPKAAAQPERNAVAAGVGRD
ncbi:N-acetylmuramoyl-L-alanine amidase [Methylovirgula sp. 4M-Z18]|uniref:N-acetylmuramoyl-L-alanine amidase n=1 Tax=Methylovirgula sp. 4M-Z18 TaxID=2293567 RepID=UPI001313EBB7|nr:N-acetylmuramoyl-L-alanine amidase [Methylovirgula sp. 4M-Z18]